MGAKIARNAPLCFSNGFREFRLAALKEMAGTTRLELATSAVTGQRSNQLNYVPAIVAPAWNWSRTEAADVPV
jgi:hypothetical protein